MPPRISGGLGTQVRDGGSALDREWCPRRKQPYENASAWGKQMKKMLIASAMVLGMMFAPMSAAIAAPASNVTATQEFSAAKKAEPRPADPYGYRGWWCSWAGGPWFFTTNTYTVWQVRLFYGRFACVDGLGF